MNLLDTIFGVASGAPASGAVAQYGSDGSIVGWYLINADGSTTSWDANGQNPETSAPSSPVVSGSAGQYIAWDPSMPYPGTVTGDPASDALSKGVPPGYVVQLYGPAFPAPPGVGPLTQVPSSLADMIGGGGPYYAVGASLAQHFLDESHITAVLPISGSGSGLSFSTLLLVGAGLALYLLLQPSRPQTIVVRR